VAFCHQQSYPRSSRFKGLWDFDRYFCELFQVGTHVWSSVLWYYQERKIMHNIRQYQLPLQRYIAMMDLQVTVHRVSIFCKTKASAFSLLFIV
jgi:hypothetical protein